MSTSGNFECLVVEQAGAKLNLGLEVVGRRPDGFHDLVTIFQEITLADHLTFEPAESIELTTNDPGLDGPDNLVWSAARALQEATGRRCGARIQLTKRIPVAAGLGGGSSDAAATLRGLSKLWNLDLPATRLVEIAVALGSDVPFFLAGGTALARGRGEKLQPLPTPPIWFTIVYPPVQLERKTRRMYEALQPGDFSDGSSIQLLATAIASGEILRHYPLPNSFRRVALELLPGVLACATALEAAGAPAVHLSGSGSALFAISDDSSQAERLACECRARGLQTYVARSRPARRSLTSEAPFYTMRG